MTLFGRKKSTRISEDIQLQEIDERHNIAQQVYFRREAKGVTQQELANMAGTTQAQIANLEAGHVNPTLRSLVRVAHALDCDIRDLAMPTNGNPGVEEVRSQVKMMMNLLRQTMEKMVVGKASHDRDMSVAGAGWLPVKVLSRHASDSEEMDLMSANTDLALSA